MESPGGAGNIARMRREQVNFPRWWLDLDLNTRERDKIRALFTITRDGYTRWYKGSPRFVCGKTTPPAEVESRWRAKAAAIDAAEAAGVDVAEPVAGPDTPYRVVLSGFLAHCEQRVAGTIRPAMAERTLHNYDVALNAFGAFAFKGRKVADTPIGNVGPDVFSAYAATFAGWAASGFDSVVTRVSAMMNWAVEMDYLERWRAGPAFRRPAKAELRDQRIAKAFAFSAEEVARLYLAANYVMRCWIALGIVAGFNNSDVANLPRGVVDLAAGVIDFRRRKTGKVRRVIPLPGDVADLLRGYSRPAEPATPADADLFFLTERGNAYARTRNSNGKPSNTISRLFARLMADCGLPTGKGRNFKGLRTSVEGLAPAGFVQEVEAILGHARGTVFLDSYAESVRLERLRHVTTHIWGQVQAEIAKQRAETKPVA